VTRDGPAAGPAKPDAPGQPVGGLSVDPPLIGRASELARLLSALDRAAKGSGELALVRGEAGIGKSRLLAELASEAERRGARVLLGRAHEAEQALPFGPWVDAIRSAVARFGPDPIREPPGAGQVELAPLLPDLARDDVLPDRPPSDRPLFEAVAAFVQRLAHPGPLLLMLEDLHWADEPSLRLLAF